MLTPKRDSDILDALTLAYLRERLREWWRMTWR
jgi:hypothetical protein